MFGSVLGQQRGRGSQQDSLENARRLSRFAASRGLLVEDLSKAIGEVSAAADAADPQQKERAEQGLLLASSATLTKLGMSSVDQIRRYHSKTYSIFQSLSRCTLLSIMFFCIAIAVPLTFIFNQTTTRATQIREIDTLIQTEGVYGAGRSARFFGQAGEKRSSEAIGGESEEERVLYLSRLSYRVQFLIQPPRMMDVVQSVVNHVYRKFFSESQKDWIVTMRYYRRWYINENEVEKESYFDVQDASSITEQLQRAEGDFVFVSYILGSGILPVLYGALGASVFLARKHLFSTVETYTMSNPISEMLVRIGLGAVAGVAVGWFQFPKAAEQFTSTPLAIAFAAGFSIDIVFSFLERLISTFDFRRESPSKAG